MSEPEIRGTTVQSGAGYGGCETDASTPLVSMTPTAVKSSSTPQQRGDRHSTDSLGDTACAFEFSSFAELGRHLGTRTRRPHARDLVAAADARMPEHREEIPPAKVVTGVLHEASDEASLHYLLGALVGHGAATPLGVGLLEAKGLHFVLEQVHNARVDGDRQVLRAAVADGMARTLAAALYPESPDPSGYIEAGLAGPRAAKALGLKEGDPVQAYYAGADIAHRAVSGLDAKARAELKRELLDLMPGSKQHVERHDNASSFHDAVVEYLNPDIQGRRVRR